jgi:hypothetical protein
MAGVRLGWRVRRTVRLRLTVEWVGTPASRVSLEADRRNHFYARVILAMSDAIDPAPADHARLEDRSPRHTTPAKRVSAMRLMRLAADGRSSSFLPHGTRCRFGAAAHLASSGGAYGLDHKPCNGLQAMGGSMSLAMASARELLLRARCCAQQARRGTRVHVGAEAT